MKNESQFKLIFDMRSSSVGFSVVEFSKDTNPRIIYAGRKYIEFEEKQTGETFVNSMMSVLGMVCQNMVQKGLLEVKKINPNATISQGYIFYSSPWYVSYIKDVTTRKKKSFEFKREEFEKIVREQSGVDKASDNSLIIEKDITHVCINGYEVSNPFDKKVKELSFSLYISEMNKQTYKSIQDQLEKVFPKVNFFHKTHPLVLFSTLRNIFPHNPTFLFLDIGGELTDIGVVECNVLVNSISIPYGRNYVLRETSRILKLPIESTISKLEMVYDGEIHGKEAKLITDAVDVVKGNWISKIKQSIENLGIEIPRHIFIGSDKDVRSMFIKFMSDPSLCIKEENNTSMTNIVSIDNSLLDHLLFYEPSVQKDIFLGVESLFLHNDKIHI